jgi:large subunit ribosomal protein L24
VQTTLLGVAIAFIIALLAALIGPYFIDWNQFRPQFEAEATRIIGAPVRVDGALDARLLPTPSLRLHSLVVGGRNDLGKVRADKLDVEFSLGSLMRGEWRANELTINGVSLDLGLDRNGKIDWPVSSRTFSLGSVAIDRLNLTGRVALHDAASHSTLELNDIAFSGDVRALAGSIRGDGNFLVSGTRYPFRISSSQNANGGGIRLHLALDPDSRRMSVDLDGILNFEARSPRFDGMITLAGGEPAARAGAAHMPWRISSRLKADHAQAHFAQIDASYGPAQNAMKFSGVGEMRFGAAPSLQVAVAARQLDADRILAKQDATATPAQGLAALRAMLADMPRPPVATRIDLNADQVMVRQRPVQDVEAELHAGKDGWSVDRLAFRAPGSTGVHLQGTTATDASAGFKGVLDLDSSEPRAFLAWLTGRSETSFQNQTPLRLRGNVSLGPDRLAIEGLKAEIDGGTVAGRITLSTPADKASEFDGTLTADRLDLDAAAAFLRAVAGPAGDWPDQGRLSLTVADARSSGQDLQPFIARIGYSPKAITLDRLEVGQSDGLTVSGAGRFDRDDATGNLSLEAQGPSAKEVADVLKPMAPALAERIGALTADSSGFARLKLTIDLTRDQGNRDRSRAKATLDIATAQVSGIVTMSAIPATQAVRTLDLESLSRSPADLDIELSADHGQSLLALLGLDRLVATGDGPLRLQAKASGTWRAPFRVKAALSGSDLDADAQGTVAPWANAAPKIKATTADINLTVRHADFAPLFNLGAADDLAHDAHLSSHLTLKDGKLAFGDIDSTLAGARMRGHLSVALGDEAGIDGELGLDSLDLARAFGLAIGTAGRASDKPLGRGLLQGWHGRIGFQALRGNLPGDSELHQISGTIRSDGRSVTFDGIKAKMGGGDIRIDIDAQPGSDGLALNARARLDGVDGAALHYHALAMPPGKVSMQMTLATQGRSAAALAGALSGNGSLELHDAHIAGLDPKAFDLAVEASDRGQAANEDALRQIVEPALARGSLDVASAQIPFTIRDGRLSIGATTLEGAGARTVFSGGYDIPAGQANIRATLTSSLSGPAGGHPEVELFTVGSSDSLHRSVNVAMLSSWLALRAIDRETRRLESMQRAAIPPATTAATLPPADKTEPPHETAVPAAIPLPDVPLPGGDPRRSTKPKPVPSQAINAPADHRVAPLPPPIEVKPAPKPSRPRGPLVLTPPQAMSPRPGF